MNEILEKIHDIATKNENLFDTLIDNVVDTLIDNKLHKKEIYTSKIIFYQKISAEFTKIRWLIEEDDTE